MLDMIAQNVILRIAVLVALFAGVSIMAYAVFRSAAVRHLARQRLMDAGSAAAYPDGSQNSSSLRTDKTVGAWVKLVNSIEKSGLPLTDTKDDALRMKLAAAGYVAPHAPRVYTLIRLALVILVPVAVLAVLFWVSESSPSLFKLYISLTGAALAGLYLPSLFIRAKGDRRRRELLNGFPDALDLMLVCVEAGLGLEAAFNRVGMEMTRSHPLLAEQLGAAVLEMRAGRSRDDALRRMADRAGLDEFRAFSTLLIQSTKLGSSIAQALRIYAAEMRDKRRLRAEEKAHRLPVLISIPLVACMLPCMIGVLMLPAVIRVVRQVMPVMVGN
jgi:tight adherence protein C